ncbi:MAG: DUF3011 domain-containing protein [Dokdonella sp.]
MRIERLACLAVVLLVGGGITNARADGQIECTSQNYRYTYCRADTGNVVQLTHQQSKTRCEQGRNWGYDGRGIWVDDGCGAIFEYGFRRANGHHKDKTGEIVAGVAAVAILGAILSSDKSDHDHRSDHAYERDYGRDRVPGWAVGGFHGSDRRSGDDVAVNIDGSGRVSGYQDRYRLDGQVDGDGVYLGNRHYTAQPTRDGFQLIDDDGRPTIDLYRD